MIRNVCFNQFISQTNKISNLFVSGRGENELIQNKNILQKIKQV